jgi:hypothetical protein
MGICGKAEMSKKPKIRPMDKGLGRGLAGDMGLSFLFFSNFLSDDVFIPIPFKK